MADRNPPDHRRCWGGASVSDPIFLLAAQGTESRLSQVENGVVNLVAIVGFLIVAIGLIPAVLYLGTPKALGTPKLLGTPKAEAERK